MYFIFGLSNGIDNGAIHSKWQQNREFDSSGHKQTNEIRIWQYPFSPGNVWAHGSITAPHFRIVLPNESTESKWHPNLSPLHPYLKCALEESHYYWWHSQIPGRNSWWRAQTFMDFFSCFASNTAGGVTRATMRCSKWPDRSPFKSSFSS